MHVYDVACTYTLYMNISLYILQVDEIQRQLQSCENELARKRKEAQEYEAQYHLAESKRMEAFSQINELTLVAIGMEPQREVDREKSPEQLRKLYHLVKKQNEVGLPCIAMNILMVECQLLPIYVQAWEEIHLCTIRDVLHKIEVKETEIIGLRSQLAEAGAGSTKVRQHM